MKIHVFPPSGRIVGIVALKNYLALDCELNPIDLGRGDQRAPEYVSLNPNRKIPTLEDGGIVLWESNAILFYMASKRPESGVGHQIWRARPMFCAGFFGRVRTGTPSRAAWSHTRRVRRLSSVSAYPTPLSLHVGNKTSAASPRYSTIH